jgi:hypothetical protein
MKKVELLLSAALVFFSATGAVAAAGKIKGDVFGG